MGCAAKIRNLMEKSSWIRKMFEEGARMKADGKGPVYDFSLGNPEIEPPDELKSELKRIASSQEPGMHRYMPNSGYPDVRRSVARYLSEETGLEFDENSVIMTVGAGGGLNATLKALLDPGDKVVCFSPYFVEYDFYVDNHGGRLVKVKAGPGFMPDLAALEKVLDRQVKVVLTNSPNNPTGVVYSADVLAELGRLLRRKGEETGRTIYWISDEPYRNLVYDGKAPNIFEAYDSAIVVTSHSKDLALPGERIGYTAISPKARAKNDLFDAITFTNRILGFVNAPALMQRVVASMQGRTVDLAWYERKRDKLYSSLKSFGYDVVKPEGAFYMFPKAPGGDDLAFVRKLQEKRVLVVPGRGFGSPGYFRISYCVSDEVVDAALPRFKEAIEETRA